MVLRSVSNFVEFAVCLGMLRALTAARHKAMRTKRFMMKLEGVRLDGIRKEGTAVENGALRGSVDFIEVLVHAQKVEPNTDGNTCRVDKSSGGRCASCSHEVER